MLHSAAYTARSQQVAPEHSVLPSMRRPPLFFWASLIGCCFLGTIAQRTPAHPLAQRYDNTSNEIPGEDTPCYRATAWHCFQTQLLLSRVAEAPLHFYQSQQLLVALPTAMLRCCCTAIGVSASEIHAVGCSVFCWLSVITHNHSFVTGIATGTPSTPLPSTIVMIQWSAQGGCSENTDDNPILCGPDEETKLALAEQYNLNFTDDSFGGWSSYAAATIEDAFSTIQQLKSDEGTFPQFSCAAPA